jgi:tetratricopeptide (TPR) repeat protein
MEFAPLPLDVPLHRLGGYAQATRAEFLFYSGIEQLQRPAYAVLADSGVTLPGFDQVAWEALPHGHFYAVYRFTGESVDSARFASAHYAALERYESRHINSPSALLMLAVQYLEIGNARAAASRLDRLVRAGARDPAVERYRSTAAMSLNDLGAAASACSTAMELEEPTGWHWARMGDVRTRQGRLAEARDCYQRAADLEPATLAYLELLGYSNIRLREFARAANAFERCVRLAPTDATLRRSAMGAWELAGNTSRVRELYRDGVKAGIPPAALLVGDSS